MKFRAAMLMVMDLVNIQKGSAEADAKRMEPILRLMKETREEQDAAAAGRRLPARKSPSGQPKVWPVSYSVRFPETIPRHQFPEPDQADVGGQGNSDPFTQI